MVEREHHNNGETRMAVIKSPPVTAGRHILDLSFMIPRQKRAMDERKRELVEPPWRWFGDAAALRALAHLPDGAGSCTPTLNGEVDSAFGRFASAIDRGYWIAGGKRYRRKPMHVSSSFGGFPIDGATATVHATEMSLGSEQVYGVLLSNWYSTTTTTPAA